MAKPTIVLIPGCWLPATIYARTEAALAKHGYPSLSMQLPSAGANPPHQNFELDVKGIRDCLVKLVEEEEKDVVLVVHSYTGMPGSEAPKGLGRKEREAKGRKGGVIRLVYVVAYVPAIGWSPLDLGAEFPAWMAPDMEAGTSTLKAADAKEVFFHDLPSGEADKWAASLSTQSIGVFTSRMTYAAWKDIPSTYVIGEQDRSFFTPAVAEMTINAAREVEPTAMNVVERVDAGHCLMISRPEWLADVLRRAAGESI